MLSKADLVLEGANLKRADLTDANLQGVTYDDEDEYHEVENKL